MSHSKSSRFHGVLALVSTVAVAASVLVGVSVAQADTVWVQSYERTSQAQVCEAQPGETPWQESWSGDPSWSPSWEQWANNGNGGWVCTRSITWAQTPVTAASGGGTYALGDIGPGGGLVFYIDSGSGLRYEMAPKNWNDPTNPSAVDPNMSWCDVATDVSGAMGTAIGTGAANTLAMDVACSIDAGQAAADYVGGGQSDWFLPSEDELNAMCNYSRNPAAPAPPSERCYGDPSGLGTTQIPAFAIGGYGFVGDYYWSSSQYDSADAWAQRFDDGGRTYAGKGLGPYVRVVRTF